MRSRSTRSSQSVLAVPMRDAFAGAYCVTAARNCSALSIEGRRSTVEVERLPVYSKCVPNRPFCPVRDLVVMITTPFIRDCIVDKEKTHLIQTAIAAGTSQYGMQTFDQSLLGLLRAGLELREHPIRGGTDGSRLCFMGLPTPNIFAGEHNFHSRLEWISVQDMAKAVERGMVIGDICLLEKRGGKTGEWRREA